MRRPCIPTSDPNDGCLHVIQEQAIYAATHADDYKVWIPIGAIVGMFIFFCILTYVMNTVDWAFCCCSREKRSGAEAGAAGRAADGQSMQDVELGEISTQVQRPGGESSRIPACIEDTLGLRDHAGSMGGRSRSIKTDGQSDLSVRTRDYQGYAADDPKIGAPGKWYADGFGMPAVHATPNGTIESQRWYGECYGVRADRRDGYRNY